MTTGTLTPPPVALDQRDEVSDVDAACKRVERRFDHVADDEFMTLLKTWILEILREKGL